MGARTALGWIRRGWAGHLTAWPTERATDERRDFHLGARDVAKIRLLDFPAAVDADGRVLTLRYASSGDRDRITAFVETLPSHDLLFLRRDITDRNEVAAWLEAAQGGRDWTLLALENDQVAGYVVIAGDPSPWSRHVAELRVLVSPGWRERGLGRLLVAQAFALGQRVGYERMVAQMTPDQVAAQRVFERLGFENEATLRGRVVDREGTRHDLVVMGLDLRRLPAQTGVLIEAAHDSAERSVRWEGSAELVDSNGIVIAEVAAALWKLSVEGRGESWGGQLSLSVSGEDTLLLAEEVAALRLASADPVEIATHGAVRMDLGGADPTQRMHVTGRGTPPF